MRNFLATLISALFLAQTPLVHAAPDQALPEHAGAHPVSSPEYSGIDQILVLSSSWVIVVTSTMPELMDEIDRLAHGQFYRSLDVWKKSQQEGRLDWNTRKAISALRDDYITQARENVGERALKSPETYTIQSPGDPAYADPVAPAEVGYTLVGLGAGRHTGGHEIDYAHYAYLRLPSPMKPGQRYTFTAMGDKQATLHYDESHTVSRAIKVNQIGYLSTAPRKFAYLGAHIYGVGPLDCAPYTRFEVVNADTGDVALRGEVQLRDRSARIASEGAKSGDEPPPLINGEDVYELDLTGLRETCDFFIRVPGMGRSWPFRHAPDVYAPVFKTAARALYHQRCGVACEAPYTGWTRPQCHTAPVYESDLIAFGLGEFNPPENYNVFDIVGGSIDKSRMTENVRGGWHDAADWDRRNQHYTVVFDLLYAYELAPENFTDGQLTIPESGNGVPDILDEAAFGLEVWARSMTPEGGVSGYVETHTHPRLNDDVDYAFSRRTRWDSLLFAAAAAQLAQHLKNFDGSESERWEALAKRAWAFGSDPANSLGQVEIAARRNRGSGEPYTLTWEEKENYVTPYRLHARIRMHRLTGDKSYLEGLSDDMRGFPRPYQWPRTLKDYWPWFSYALAGADSVLPDFQRKRILREHLIAPAEDLLAHLDKIPYRRTWPRNQAGFMGWGNTDMTNAGRALLIAHDLTGDARFRDAAILNFDFMLGANPMGMSWTTGLGYVYPTDIQHEISQKDGIPDPVPGITIYGVTGGMFRDLRETVWKSPGGAASPNPVVFDSPEVPLWRRWSCHPHLNVGQCEFTIQETISSTIFCAAMLIDPEVPATAEATPRAPRPAEALYGRWYLP
ncbi:MAG: glycoside hydrolase family 9 protein [Candidatus Hydrogenedentes bacterium]|nr:glycoside hydrolase family 9 protein [Candidatus Hydrogenedentota bacterium]